MKTQNKHTKTPWLVGRAHGIKGVYNVMVNEISDEEDIANAEFLALAVNCHDELVEALKGILEIGKRDMTNPKYDGYFKAAKQALAKAQERTTNDRTNEKS